MVVLLLLCGIDCLVVVVFVALFSCVACWSSLSCHRRSCSSLAWATTATAADEVSADATDLVVAPIVTVGITLMLLRVLEGIMGLVLIVVRANSCS